MAFSGGLRCLRDLSQKVVFGRVFWEHFWGRFWGRFPVSGRSVFSVCVACFSVLFALRLPWFFGGFPVVHGWKTPWLP